MGSFWDKSKGYQYVSASYALSNTHGDGGAELHKAEMEHICNEIVDQKMQQILPQLEQMIAYNTISQILEALKVDIHSIVSIALSNAGDIFYGESAQTAIMEAVFNQIVSILESQFTLQF